MSITCSRCQADNNDSKSACWNCWAVLPRPLTEEELMAEAAKGKGNNKAPALIIDNSTDDTVIIPPQPEQKKAGLFGGFGKKKIAEPAPQLEEVTDPFAEFQEPAAAEAVDTTANAGIKEVIAPSEEIVIIAPEPVKEKKGLFGFGKKKTAEIIPEPAIEIAPVIPVVPPVIPAVSPAAPILSEPTLQVPEADIKTSPAVENQPSLTNEDAPIDVPFNFDFNAEVEKVFGGTGQTPAEKDADQQNKIKRIRPVREEDGGIKRPKKPK